MCGEMLTVYGPHWVCPSSQWCVLSQSTRLRLQVALQGNCPKRALGCVHFPGLSCSGSDSWVLHKGTDSVGHAFCALLGPSSSGNQVLGELAVPCGLCHDLLPSPGHSVSWECHKGAVSAVPCVSSGALISGCDPLGRCQPPRIPGSLGQQLGTCSQFGGGCHLWGRDCPLPSSSGCRLPASLPLVG